MSRRKQKEKLCLSCMACCKTIIIETTYNSIMDPAVAVLYDLRGIKYGNANNVPFLLVPCECKFLTDKGCKVYDRRPAVCREYDGRKVSLMDDLCKWHQLEEVEA